MNLKNKLPVFIIALMLFGNACSKKKDPVVEALPFEAIPVLKSVAPWINEASGIADSKANTGMLWVQEDSGNPSQLFLLGKDGTVFKKIFFKAAPNRDWEDIAVAAGPQPGKNYLYLGEIGDNNTAYPSVSFYRMEEPLAATDTIRTADTINFKYADGPRDAEAFLVDNTTKDIFIITKREARSRLYKLSYPYSSSMNTAAFLFDLPYNLVVSAAISADNKELIIKTYSSLYYYQRSGSETIDQALQKNAVTLSYQQEPQGEAITFANDNTGFFALSENPGAVLQQLQFYKRK